MSAAPFLDLVNTEHIHDADRVTDRLDEPGAAERLERRWNVGCKLTADDVAALRAFRGILRPAIEELMRTGTLGLDSVEALNAALSRTGPGHALVTVAGGGFAVKERWSDPVALVAASFARAIAEDDPRRIKLCANPHCRWAFRDDSKNRSRRWCSSEACGNVAKLRAFRSRARSRGSE
ncbi:MAG: CGNR zinc finger domain-containing protein [Methylobacteriaceae bacterium]|nr:CGNR zinc finger domain-containing protein [Methylobacteriaceae bacterium]